MTDLNDLLGVRAALVISLIDGPVAADREEPDPVLIFQITSCVAQKILRPFDASVTDDGYSIMARVDTPDTAGDDAPLAWSEIAVAQTTIDEAKDRDPVAMITTMLLERWADEARVILGDHFAPADESEVKE